MTCLLRRDLPEILPVRSNADLRPLIVCTISSVNQSGSQVNDTDMSIDDDERTGEFGTLRLELVPLVPAVAMHDDSECGRGRFAGLARDDAVDVVRRRLAAVKDRLGGFVRRRHDL